MSVSIIPRVFRYNKRHELDVISHCCFFISCEHIFRYTYKFQFTADEIQVKCVKTLILTQLPCLWHLKCCCSLLLLLSSPKKEKQRTLLAAIVKNWSYFFPFHATISVSFDNDLECFFCCFVSWNSPILVWFLFSSNHELILCSMSYFRS